MSSSNYIQDYVYGLPGVSQKRNFDENGNSIDPDFTYGDIKTSLTQRNINKDLNIHKDRVKKIHREAMNIRDTSNTKGRIWTRMDQDDPRMGRYNFPNKPDYPVGSESGNLQYGRDITDVINAGASSDNDIKALREFLTKNTIAPEYNKWIKYGTEEPPYGFKLSIAAISNKIDSIVPDHDTQNNEVNIDSGSNDHDYSRSVNIDGTVTPFDLEKGLEADKLNIYSYVVVESNKNPTNVTKKYYYIPSQPFKFTDTVAETGGIEGQYYRRYYERYHIVNSKVNSLRDDNSLRYSYDGSNFDLANLGNEFIFDINTDGTSTTDINTTLALNNSNIEYGDYFREYSKKKWKVYGTAAPSNGRRLNIASGTVTSTEITSTTTNFTFDKDLSDNSALNNIYLTKDDYFVYNDGSTDYYIVSAEPGRTVWMITKSATKENEDKATLQTEVRDVRNEAMNVRDSLSTEPSQLWLKMNRNDPRNSQYLYPELTPIYWSSNGNIKPEMGRDLENVLDNSNFSTLRNYVVDTANHSIDNYYTCNLSLEPIYFYDYLNANYSNYYTIDYDKSRKEMGMGISSVVSNFLIGTPSSTSNNYILNSKIDTKTQNVLMDSLLEKQYGDLYVMNTASSDSNDTRIKSGDYYIKPVDQNYVFGQVWVKTNLNKKLDFGRELYDSELTEILKSIVNPTSGIVLSSHTLVTSNFTTKFTTTDLANLGIKSLDYIYVCTDTNEDYYFKAMPNTNGIYDGRKWDQVVVGAKPDESFGRQLYHQNLSEELHTSNEIILDASYSNLNLDKLNLEPTNYILDRNDNDSYRPKPIDIWLSVRSTENQHVYNKHRQESVSDNKYIAQDVRQNSDVPGQIWKKMTATEAENLKFDYGAITPLAWVTTSNGEIEPKKGRNLNEYLSGPTTSNVLIQLKKYINQGTSTNYNLDTFNSNIDLRDFSDNGGFNHDDYILVDKNNSGTDLNKPHKYYTINYDVSRNLNTTRDGSSVERLNIHTSKTSDELIKFLTENNFENYSENYNYPYKKYYVDILNSTRDSKTNIITKYGDEYILLDHRDVPNREDVNNTATLVPNNIKYGDYYKDGSDAWVAIRSHKKQKEYDDNTNYNEVRTLAKRKRSESTTAGDIWIKMKKTDPRFSKYNYENLDVSSALREITTLTQDFEDFLEKNINLYNGSEQISFVLDSKVDFRTNRITEYGNEYVVTFDKDTYNGAVSPVYGKYHKKETTNYGDTWYSIGTEKPDKGRLIVSTSITNLIQDANWSSGSGEINERFINVYATETGKGGNNSENVTVLQFLKDFNLTDDDYIQCNIGGTLYFRPKPHDVWVVTRSLDEQEKYDEKIRIKYRDVYQEAKAIRQSSKTIGQIWIQVDSLDDPRISKDKYPHRRQLTSGTTITGQLQTLLQTYTATPYTADSGDSNISEFQREIYKSDGSSMVLDYVQNRFYVVDSDIDMATYQIKYDDSQNPLSVRSGLGKELVILDKNKIPNIDSGDQDSVIIDGKDMGQILRYGDYYSSGGKYYVVSRSYDEEHAKDLADQALKDLERANQNELDSNTLLNTYQFSDTDDRYGRLWQKVTTLDEYIISSNQKILKHNFAENSLESNGLTLKLTNTELNNLLSDFTMTEVLSTKYIKHPTKNQYYVTTDYGNTWVKHETLPEVGTEIFIKKEGNNDNDLYYTNNQDMITSNYQGHFADTTDSSSNIELSNNEVFKLLLFNNLIDKHYIEQSNMYYETDNVYLSTSNQITWNKVDLIPLDKKLLQIIPDYISNNFNGSNSITIDSTEYENLLTSNDYNSWAEHNSRKRHFVTQYINKDNSNYYISNDGGYNWKEIDSLNKVHNNSNFSYEIVHSTTKTILNDDGRTLLTTDELDDLLNNAKYSATHGNGTTLTSDLNSQYVSHRLLTNQHYLTDGTNYYIPQPLVNEDYKNYINMPGKGKLGKYWKLRYVVDASTPTLTEITLDSTAKEAIRDILEGNDNDINRYQYNKERLTLTKDERNVIAGGELVAITQNNYISHSVKPNYNYMSNDNGYNWFKVHNISDSSVKLIQLEQDRDYNGNDIDLGNILYKIYKEDIGYGSYGSFDNKASNEFYINDNVFNNYEVEKYVRENGYIQHTDGSGVTYSFVPGEYINENYNYFAADNEYPAKNTLGRIWNTLDSSVNVSTYTNITNTTSDKLKELLYSKNILEIDLSANNFKIDLQTNSNIYYQATDNKFYYPVSSNLDGSQWLQTTIRPDDKLEFRLDELTTTNSANSNFNIYLIDGSLTMTPNIYNSIELDLDSTRNVYYKVVDSSDTYYYIPTDETKERWYAQKDEPVNSLRIVQNGDNLEYSLSNQLIPRTSSNMNIKGSNPTVTLSYEEYALYVESSNIDIDEFIQVGNKYYVPGRLINDYQDNFHIS